MSVKVLVVAGAAVVALSAAVSTENDQVREPLALPISITPSSEVTPQKAAWRFVVEGAGNKARYRVRERLAGKELDNDAIGETPRVAGAIVLDDKGKVITSESFFTAQVDSLVSDQSRRDNYVRRRVLTVDSFPTTTLRITEVRGLPSPLPKNGGEAKFQIVGDLTVRGVTKPTTWNVSAVLKGDQLTGTAATRFTFSDFNIPQPRVPMVLSLSDSIGLEYDFSMMRKK